MKKIFITAIPLTIISFAVFTKWWYVLPVDGTDDIMFGFPLIYKYPCCSSMQFMIILKHLIIDILVYFAFWFAIVFNINKFLFKINVPKIITIPLWIISIFNLLLMGFDYHISGKYEWTERDFIKGKEIMETGYKFIWEEVERPDYYKYHPEKRH